MFEGLSSIKLKKTETKVTDLGKMVDLDCEYGENSLVEQRILLIHHGDRLWIGKSAKCVVLLTTKEREKNMETALKLKYTQVIGLDHFDTTGLVEFYAVQLNKKYNFTHVCYLPNLMVRNSFFFVILLFFL